MCGIFGHTVITGHDRDKSRSALHTLAHRGPDQWRDWEDDKIYSGHRRLSIIDLSEAGRQPMISEDGNVILAVNGEIYNFKDLRAELENDFRFKSHSDSETLLHGYRKWGMDALLHKLDGMFAFSLYDKAKGVVYLVRDQVGIKPLYYAVIGGQILWASELKAIESYIGKSHLKIDYSAIYDYLTYLYVPAPKSMYQYVFKLPPAHVLCWDIGKSDFSLRRYWQLEANANNDLAEKEAAEKLRAVIASAVKMQQVADVPVGFFLSGGVDSSAVVAEAAMMGGDLHSYTIGFDDKGRDESPYARLVAEHYQTRHTVKHYSSEDTDRQLPMLKDWYDEPFADFSAFPTYLVSKLARESAKVVLTGDGGDELFGGYRWYKKFSWFYNMAPPSAIATIMAQLRPTMSWLKNNHRHTIFGKIANRLEFYTLTDKFEIYAKLMGGMLRADKKELRTVWNIPSDYDDYWVFRQWWRDDLPLFTRLQYLDFHSYLPDDILTKVDRTSMSVALEARVPLLALPVVEFAFSVPEDIRLPGGELKGMFKRAYNNMLPPAIISRGKQGFSIPPGKMSELRSADRKPPQLVALQKLFPEIRLR